MVWIYVCALVVVLFWWQVKRALKQKSKPPDPRLPGPSGLPVVGNALQLDIVKPHFTLTEMANRHGPIFKMKLVTDHWVVINNYDLAREACITKGQDFSGRPVSYRFSECMKDGQYIFDDLKGNCLIQRTLMAKAVTLSGVSSKQIEPEYQEMIRDLLDGWAEKNSKCSTCHDEESCSVCGENTVRYSCRDDISRFACRLMTKGILGEVLDMDSPVIDQLMKMERYITISLGTSGQGLILDLFPWSRFLGNKAWKLLTGSFAISKSIYSTFKPQVLESMDCGVNQSAMHVVLNQALRGNKDITDTMAQGIMTLLYAGAVSTTSTMMHGVLVVLADHPDIQEKIRREVESVIGDATPDIKHSESLPYTMATIIEISRNVPLSVLGVPHKAVCDTSLAGYDIPKGVNAMMNMWAIHHDEDFWEDPFTFKPERFLTPDGQLLLPDHPRRRRVMAFGAGPRSCIGEAFARKHIFLLTTSLCQRYIFKLQVEGGSDPKKFEVNGLTLEPPKCGVIFVERN